MSEPGAVATGSIDPVHLIIIDSSKIAGTIVLLSSLDPVATAPGSDTPQDVIIARAESSSSQRKAKTI